MTTIDRAELMRWNAEIKRSRESYYAHPMTSSYSGCRKPYCVCRTYRKKGGDA